LVSEEKVLVY